MGSSHSSGSILNSRIAYFQFFQGVYISSSRIWEAYSTGNLPLEYRRYVDYRFDILDCLYQCGAGRACDRSGNGRHASFQGSVSLADCPPVYAPPLAIVFGTNNGALGPRSVRVPALVFGGDVVLELRLRPLQSPAHGAVLFDFGNYDPLSASTKYNVDSLVRI
eukprot:tig00001221_g7593.t1